MDKDDLREEGFIQLTAVACHSREVTVAGTGHITPQSRIENNGLMPTCTCSACFFTSYSIPDSFPGKWCHLQWEDISIKVFMIIPHRHVRRPTQCRQSPLRFPSQGILDCVKLAVRLVIVDGIPSQSYHLVSKSVVPALYSSSRDRNRGRCYKKLYELFVVTVQNTQQDLTKVWGGELYSGRCSRGVSQSRWQRSLH